MKPKDYLRKHTTVAESVYSGKVFACVSKGRVFNAVNMETDRIKDIINTYSDLMSYALYIAILKEIDNDR